MCSRGWAGERGSEKVKHADRHVLCIWGMGKAGGGCSWEREHPFHLTSQMREGELCPSKVLIVKVSNEYENERHTLYVQLPISTLLLFTAVSCHLRGCSVGGEGMG